MLIQWRLNPQAFHQVRVGDEAAPERDGIDQPTPDQVFAFLCGIGTCGNDDPWVSRPNSLTERIAQRLATSPVRLGQVQVGQVALGQLLDQVQPCCLLIFAIVHAIETT
ncbi:hypothetical protein D3C73_1359800 [compost metagenome]